MLGFCDQSHIYKRDQADDDFASAESILKPWIFLLKVIISSLTTKYTRRSLEWGQELSLHLLMLALVLASMRTWYSIQTKVSCKR